jgi:Asp-tRNA(Asn)/Glu-tRNA(Gln) amidotransferase A subunit family amidase
MDLHELSIQQAHEYLSSRKISSEELTRAYLERIQRLDLQIKSYVTVSEESALEQARCRSAHPGRRTPDTPDRHPLLCKRFDFHARCSHDLLLQNS